jgi:hypothetical protein
MNSTIHIPGRLTAKISNGRIIGYVFDIAANDAGYFGDAFNLIEGDEMTANEFSDLVTGSLMFTQDRKSAFFSVELGA